MIGFRHRVFEASQKQHFGCTSFNESWSAVLPRIFMTRPTPFLWSFGNVISYAIPFKFAEAPLSFWQRATNGSLDWDI